MEDIPPGTDLSQIPLAPNPNGDPPNFDDGPNLQWTILVTGVIFIVISSAFVIIRLWTSLKNTRKLHLDDYFCSLGVLAGIASWIVLYQLQVIYGTAKHTWDIPVTVITPRVMKGQSAVQVLGSVAHTLVKGSILLFFVRLFGTLRWIRISCYGLLISTLALYGAYLIGLLCLCIPARGQAWDSALLARCSTTAPATITIGVCGMIIDMVIFIIPFFIISGLHAKQRQKKGLVIVFLVGFLIVVTSVVGLAYRVMISYGNADPMWNGAKVSILAYTEIFGTIIVSCAPALSSFWFGIFVKSSFYSSLRSVFSLSRLQGQSILGGSSPQRQEVAHKCSADGCSQHAHFDGASNRLGTPVSTQELVERPIPLHTIHRSTLITQHSSEGLHDAGAQQYRQVPSNHITRNDW